MGWLRLVSSLKFQVSFAKEPYTREDILQKRPVSWRSLLMVATTYFPQLPLTHLKVTHSHAWRDSFMCDVTHSRVWHDCQIRRWSVVTLAKMHTGWRRLIRYLESKVIFCKRATNYRALLQEMTYKDEASYGSSPQRRMPYLYGPCPAIEPCNHWLFCGKGCHKTCHEAYMRQYHQQKRGPLHIHICRYIRMQWHATGIAFMKTDLAFQIEVCPHTCTGHISRE